ncbi:pre-mRNA-splicing factor CWC25 homolog isoform X2 [Abrus precatorius]|uniref:Pre-mRNA-splicing factor CWC25 homolog isoform X2 n=1 Tax=Abrus precatorius TaxID=3816 RepID=A0A8B8JEY0_ABRPR|nr:pre-mRNA-splicing factor CWC25 homolog isoform X2 [Abrus precatorius]
MALKFLNKKGWHTGSLRNIENVWKAEQKHEAEQKKLDELRKQIQEERERTEFRLLQEKAGLVPHQERLEFLYDSGLSVGKSANSEGFKALEQFPKSDAADAASSSASASKQGASVPGALFEDKPQSANDAWRKLHTDPLLMIRQREQEALAKIKNNPVKMAMIKKSVEGMEPKEKDHKEKEKRKKHHSSKSKPKKQSDSEDDAADRRKRKTSNGDFDNKYTKSQSYSEDEMGDGERKRKKNHYEDKKYRERSTSHQQRQRNAKDYKEDAGDRNYSTFKSERYASEGQSNKRGDGRFSEATSSRSSATLLERGSHYKRRNVAPKLSEEERASKLRQMQLAAEVHEEQRWKRIKKAEESDAQEAVQNKNTGGRNFLDNVQKSVYGAAEGGSKSIAESVRRRTHYSQGRSAGEGNAFRR